MNCNFIMFKEDEWSWCSIPEGKHQWLEFTEHVTRNFNFRNREFLHFIHTPGLWVQILFFICHWQAVIDFLMGVKSWFALAAVQKAPEGKQSNGEVYLNSPLLIPVLSKLLFSDCHSANKLGWCQKVINFHPLPCGWEKINTRSLQRNSGLEEGGELNHLSEYFGKLPLFMFYLPLIFTTMYSSCDLPFC